MPRSLTTHIDSPRGVGRRLKKAREGANISQRQLAFPGCTGAYISRLEAGARVPSLQMIMALAERLNVAWTWLARGAEMEDVMVGIADEYGTIWAGEPGASERIGDLVQRRDEESFEVRVRFAV